MRGGLRSATPRELLLAATVLVGSVVIAVGIPAPALAGPWSSSTTIDTASVAAVSCPATTFCVALDQSGNALMYNGTQWSSPVDIDGSTALDSVSCPTTRFCMAVDTNGQAVAYNGTTWLAPTDVDGSHVLESVSCSSPSFCDAVDGRGNVVTFDALDSPPWSAPDDIDGSNVLTAVSCPSSGFCMAVDQSGNAFDYFAGEWVSDRTGSGTGLDSVSCPTENICTAVDAIGEALSYYKGTWAASPTDVDGSNTLSSVTCLSVDFCMAVDQSGNAVAYNGVNWVVTDIDSTNQLNAVSCAKTSVCVAVDSSGDAVVYSNPVQITTASLPAAADMATYSTTLGASGGDPPYRWALSGALPPGLHLNRTAGIISGTPERGGLFDFTLIVSDRSTQTSPHTDNVARKAMSIAVDEAPAFTSPPRARAEAGVSFSFTVRTKGYPAASLTETGALPSGFSFTDNGNGTATLAGIALSNSQRLYPLTLSASNASGTTRQSFRLTVR